eukprot:CAMPEP_0182448460 /NCGR_PEP_ID=MMETSP1172-20130603/27087_1 /TAXON_ID=708627 /ORGANISM="Timspurckia oligopyrenoides, Strain CCMP3278" /LENGTH=215 /DNA_ID=CAMNT_0024645333 /DNA_START=93 /DNA_END=736 /DNA_ORIENTATION=-
MKQLLLLSLLVLGCAVYNVHGTHCETDPHTLFGTVFNSFVDGGDCRISLSIASGAYSQFIEGGRVSIDGKTCEFLPQIQTAQNEGYFTVVDIQNCDSAFCNNVLNVIPEDSLEAMGTIWYMSSEGTLECEGIRYPELEVAFFKPCDDVQLGNRNFTAGITYEMMLYAGDDDEDLISVCAAQGEQYIAELFTPDVLPGTYQNILSNPEGACPTEIS